MLGISCRAGIPELVATLLDKKAALAEEAEPSPFVIHTASITND